MALSIKDEQTDKLVRELAALTGENYTHAVMQAVKERLERLSTASDAAKHERAKKIKAFLAGRKPASDKDGYDHKKVTDALWES